MAEAEHLLVRYWRLDGFHRADLECSCGWRVHGIPQAEARRVFLAHQVRS